MFVMRSGTHDENDQLKARYTEDRLLSSLPAARGKSDAQQQGHAVDVI